MHKRIIQIAITLTILLGPIIGIVMVEATSSKNQLVIRPDVNIQGVPQLLNIQQYPKIIMEYEVFDEPSNQEFIESEIAKTFDDVYDDFKEIMRAAVSRNPNLANVVITDWHYHQSTGAIDESERLTPDTTIFFQPLTLSANSPAVQGIPIKIAGFPNGVSGYSVRVFFDPGIVEIDSVIFPPQGIDIVQNLLPNSVEFAFVDFGNQLSGISQLENLAIINVRAIKEGVAQIDIEIDALDDDSGSRITPRVLKGLVEVR